MAPDWLQSLTCTFWDLSRWWFEDAETRCAMHFSESNLTLERSPKPRSRICVRDFLRRDVGGHGERYSHAALYPPAHGQRAICHAGSKWGAEAERDDGFLETRGRESREKEELGVAETTPKRRARAIARSVAALNSKKKVVDRIKRDASVSEYARRTKAALELPLETSLQGAFRRRSNTKNLAAGIR